jgi:hypothetical protein
MARIEKREKEKGKKRNLLCSLLVKSIEEKIQDNLDGSGTSSPKNILPL